MPLLPGGRKTINVLAVKIVGGLDESRFFLKGWRCTDFTQTHRSMEALQSFLYILSKTRCLPVSLLLERSTGLFCFGKNMLKRVLAQKNPLPSNIRDGLGY